MTLATPARIGRRENRVWDTIKPEGFIKSSFQVRSCSTLTLRHFVFEFVTSGMLSRITGLFSDMKRILLFFLIAFCSYGFHPRILVGVSGQYLVRQSNATVYVCMSTGAYAYHTHFCQGLKRCKADIAEMSVNEARSRGRKPCGYCY